MKSRSLIAVYFMVVVAAAVVLRRLGLVQANYIDLSLPFLATMPYVTRAVAPLFSAFVIIFGLSMACFIYYPQPVNIVNIIIATNILLAFITVVFAIRK